MSGTKKAVRVKYLRSYDMAGAFPNLSDYSQTFTHVKEEATTAQLQTYAQALMQLTVYADAPYKIQILELSEPTED